MTRLLDRGVIVAVLVLLAVVPAVPSAAEPRDLQALVDATAPGETLRVASGTYSGNVNIDKPITIVGEGWPVVDAGGKGNGFNLSAPDVTIQGFVVRNTGVRADAENAAFSTSHAPRARIEDNHMEEVLYGVFMRSSPDSAIANNEISARDLPLGRRGDGIRLWESHGSTIEGNTLTRGRDVVFWFSNDLTIRDNKVSGNRYGMHFMYCERVDLERNWLERNSVGAFFMYSRRMTLTDNVLAFNRGPSGYGAGFKDVDGIEAEGNRIVGNRVGVYLDNSPTTAKIKQHFTSNLFAYNEIGVDFSPSVKNNIFSENAFIDNREQVGKRATGKLRGNDWTADGVGNYWSDFAGYDADGNGLGDVEYRIEDLFSYWTDQNPNLLFYSETPAARAVDLASVAFPVMRPDPKVVDDAALVAVPELTPMPRDAPKPSVGTLALASAGLVALALLIFAASGSGPFRLRHRRPEVKVT